jgi:hypothetical protein
MKTYRKSQNSKFLFQICTIIFSVVLLSKVGPAANAAVITFGEIPPSDGNSGFLTEEYAVWGIHFTTDDGEIWGGLSAGDPGNWGIEGTNGPAFLGLNGESYSLTASFDVEMNYISLDVSRSNGSSQGDTFTLEAYNGATLLDSQTVVLNSINDWTTVSLSVANIDRIDWFGSGIDYHPYGVDNLTFVPEPATICLLGLGALSLLRRKR